MVLLKCPVTMRSRQTFLWTRQPSAAPDYKTDPTMFLAAPERIEPGDRFPPN